TTTLAGGINFNDNWHTKTDVNGSYFYNRADDKIDQNSTTQYLLPDNAYLQNQNNTRSRHNENHGVNFNADTKLDSFNSLKIPSSLIYQNSSSASATNYS